MAQQQPRRQLGFDAVFAVVVIVLLLLTMLVWIMVSPPGMLLGL
jgi:hypothetical protein